MCDVFIYFSVDLEGMNLQDAAATGKLDAIGNLSDDGTNHTSGDG